jgi:creatine kinase
MNISVTEALGLPPQAYLSFRVGDTRRQGPFKQGEPFSFPNAGPANFILDVFEKVGSTQVSLDDLEDDGETVNNVFIRRKEAPRIHLSVKISKAAVPEKKNVLAAKTSRQQVAAKAKTYLEEHKIQDILQTLVHSLLTKLPEDPIEYMYDFIASHRNPMRPGVPIAETKPNCSRDVPLPPETEKKAPVESEQKAPVESGTCWSVRKFKEAAEQEAKAEPTEQEAKAEPTLGKPDKDALEGFACMPGLGNEEYPGFPVDAIPDKMPDLQSHHSVMAQVLKTTPSLYDDLRDKITSQGINFAKVIKPGIDNQGHPLIKSIGAVAGDEDSYDVFKALFDPAISNWHQGVAPDAVHPTVLDPLRVIDTNMDPEGKFVVSCSITSGRNIRGLRLTPAITMDERREVERVVTRGLLELTGDLQGEYYPLSGSSSYALKPEGMDFEDEEALSEGGFLFREPDAKYALSSGIGRHWPDARGVYLSDQKDFMVWLNEEDHIQLTKKQNGANMQDVFTSFCKAESALLDCLKLEGYEYMQNDHLGFLTASPANLGTGLKVVVRVRLPKLASNDTEFKKLMKGMMSLKEFSVENDVIEIQNRVRLGLSEVEIVNSVIEGVQKLVQREIELSA